MRGSLGLLFETTTSFLWLSPWAVQRHYYRVGSHLNFLTVQNKTFQSVPEFSSFLSSHTVGCCSINFSCLSQIRREKILLCKQCLCVFVVLFCATAVVSMPRLLFTLRPPNFCFSPTPYAYGLLKIEFFSNVHGWLLRKEDRKRNFLAKQGFANIKAKSCFLHCFPL